MSLSRRQPRLERPAPALNDCDLQAKQQQAIEGAGYTNPANRQGEWKATDSSGNSSTVDPSVYREGNS
jgi:hypothetical protein